MIAITDKIPFEPPLMRQQARELQDQLNQHWSNVAPPAPRVPATDAEQDAAFGEERCAT